MPNKKIFYGILVILAVIGGITYFYFSISILPAKKTTQGIDVKHYLPLEAKIAEIPESPIFYADTDNDGEKEIIVAYYTSATTTYETGAGESKEIQSSQYFLTILHKTDTGFTEIWKQNTGETERLAYLDVEDVNQDGKIEIIFEDYYGASIGGQVFILSWENGEYKILNDYFSWGTKVKDLNNDGLKEIIMVNRYNYYLPEILKWDKEKYIFDNFSFPNYYKNIILEQKNKIPKKENEEYGYYAQSIGLARAYQYAGLADEAIKLGEEINSYFSKADEPSPIGVYEKLRDINITLGELYESKGIYEKAKEHYESVLNYDKNNPQALEKLKSLR